MIIMMIRTPLYREICMCYISRPCARSLKTVIYSIDKQPLACTLTSHCPFTARESQSYRTLFGTWLQIFGPRSMSGYVGCLWMCTFGSPQWLWLSWGRVAEERDTNYRLVCLLCPMHTSATPQQSSEVTFTHTKGWGPLCYSTI